MPELPEVETIVSDLNKKIKDFFIVDFETNWPKSVKLPLGIFKKKIKGQKIKKIKRRGKNILIFLSSSEVMAIHLKMTGHLLVKSSQPSSLEKGFFREKVNQYIRHIWKLKKGRRNLNLEFSDLRKFGKIRLIKESELEKDKELQSLGIEPLSKEFNLGKLEEILAKKKKASLRNILMDQSLIAGIGNIYVSEILFDAKLSPLRKPIELKQPEKKALWRSIKKILKKAVEERGTSDSDYRDTSGAPGGFQKLLKVYNREKQPCPRKGCRGTILRKKINQRSAFWCPKCQR